MAQPEFGLARTFHFVAPDFGKYTPNPLRSNFFYDVHLERLRRPRKSTSIRTDLGKTTFHLVALDDHSEAVIEKKFSRDPLLACTANLRFVPSDIEACSGTHFIGVDVRSQGHDIRQIRGFLLNCGITVARVQ